MRLEDYYNNVKKGQIKSDINLQRDIVYSSSEKALVIDSIMNDIPLPAFYLWKTEDGTLEVLDGKQRTESIFKFKDNSLELETSGLKYCDMSADQQQKLDNTELTIIECSGTEEKRRTIFYRINALGKSLSRYEIINGLYNGTYLNGLTDYCRQPVIKKVLGGNNSRGRYQEKLLQFIVSIKDIKTENQKEVLENYVCDHRNDSFEKDKKMLADRIKFINRVFSKPSKHIDLYFKIAKTYYKNISIWEEQKEKINEVITETEKSLEYKEKDSKIKDEMLEAKILAVVDNIDLDEIRIFTSEQKRELIKNKSLMNPAGKCECQLCHKWFYPEELEMDHIEPWSKGGRTELSNAQLLCRTCNARKGNKK